MENNCTHPSYKMEADFSADPIWCEICGANLDINDFLLSEELRSDLDRWVVEYGTILEESNYGEKKNKHVIQRLEKHNIVGQILFKKVKLELGKETDLKYIESSF